MTWKNDRLKHSLARRGIRTKAKGITREMYSSKLHGCTVTEANVNYTGSIGIGKDMIKAANFLDNEKVLVVNLTNGQRAETYVIEADNGQISMNGGMAYIGKPGDKLVIVSFKQMDEKSAKKHKPKAVFFTGKNKIKEVK